MDVLRGAPSGFGDAPPRLLEAVEDILDIRLEHAKEEAAGDIVNELRWHGIGHLHYMAKANTLAMIALNGIWSYCEREIQMRNSEIRRLEEVMKCTSIADPDVQRIRHEKKVPGGRTLHHYVPLYFAVHTPMQRKLAKDNIGGQNQMGFAEISVSSVFDIDGVRYTDGNAADRQTRFYARTNVARIDWAWVLKEKDKAWEFLRPYKAAEVLVPDRVSTDHILRYVFISDKAADWFRSQVETAAATAETEIPDIQTKVDSQHFLRLEDGQIVSN